MNFNLLKTCPLLFCIALTMAVSGCMTTRTYIDSPLPRYSYDQLIAREPPLHLEVIAEYQLNGVRVGANGADGAEFFKLYEPKILEIANEVFEHSKLIAPSADGADGKIKVVINSDGFSGFRFATLMTWGLIGSNVNTHYDIEIIVALKNKTIRRFQTKYDVHTAVGITDLPNGVEVPRREIEFRDVLEQSLLKVLKGMGPGEEQGIVPMNSNAAGS